jgi:response regulator RpfG family c-di-GMP phosphodiesterase
VEEAARELRAGAGRQFDPECVEALLGLLDAMRSRPLDAAQAG